MSSNTIRGEFKRGLRSSHREWALYSQKSDEVAAEIAFEHFGTRVVLAGQRIEKPPARATYKISQFRLSSLL